MYQEMRMEVGILVAKLNVIERFVVTPAQVILNSFSGNHSFRQVNRSISEGLGGQPTSLLGSFQPPS